MATETSLSLEPGKITQRALFINLLILYVLFWNRYALYADSTWRTGEIFLLKIEL